MKASKIVLGTSATVEVLAVHAYLVCMSETQVTLAANAAARVSAIAAKQGKPAILRLSVEGGGCSGFQYKFGLADAPEDGDTIAETDGVKLLVDDVSLGLLEGSVVEYVESLGGAAFKVTNPQAASGCGCGSSFAI
jgi:iron-sulfur cluster insertion protein